MRFKDDRETSDSYSFEAESTNGDFELAHPPDPSRVLSAFVMPAHLFILQYRTHDHSIRNPQRQDTIPILEP
jgi:hypothetical protein